MQLITLVVLAFLLTAGYIVYDGLNDKVVPSDCALVLGHPAQAEGEPATDSHPALDLAAKLYHDQTVPLIIVSAAVPPGFADPVPGMAQYLEAHGVPATDIVETNGGSTPPIPPATWRLIMQARGLRSVLIVGPYYHIVRTKLALAARRHPPVRPGPCRGAREGGCAAHRARDCGALVLYLPKRPAALASPRPPSRRRPRRAQ